MTGWPFPVQTDGDAQPAARRLRPADLSGLPGAHRSRGGPADIGGPVGGLPAGRAGLDGGELADRQVVRTLRDAASELLATAEAARADRLSGEHRRALAADCIAQGVGAWVAEQARSGHAPTAALEQRLARAVFDAMFGLGRLQAYADLPDVENIDVYGTDPVWLSYSDGRVEQGEPVADTDAELVELIQGFARYLGHTPRTFSPATPLLRMRVAGGHRLTAAMTVSARPQLTLRKHLLVDVTLDDLIELGTLDPALAAFLRACVRAGKNLLISGAMNVGKTTLLRALANELDPTTKISTLETEYELALHQLPHRHGRVDAYEEIQDNAEAAGGLSLPELVTHALRTSAQWTIVGEARGAEIVPMLQAMSAGNRSMSTIHAATGRAVLNRIVSLAGMGPAPLGADTAYRLTSDAVDFIVHLELSDQQSAAGRRRVVSSVLEVLEVGDAGLPALNEIFVPGTDRRAVPGCAIACLPDLVHAGLDPSDLSAPAASPPRGTDGRRQPTGPRTPRPQVSIAAPNPAPTSWPPPDARQPDARQPAAGRGW